MAPISTNTPMAVMTAMIIGIIALLLVVCRRAWNIGVAPGLKLAKHIMIVIFGMIWEKGF